MGILLTVPGVRILGSTLTDGLEAAERTREALAPTIVGRLGRKLDLTDKLIARLGGSPSSTFHARERNGKLLSPEHSSRLYRIAKATEPAEACFEKDKGLQALTHQPEGRSGERDAADVRVHA